MQWLNKAQPDTWTAIRATGTHTCIARVLAKPNSKPSVEIATIIPEDIRQKDTLKTLIKKYQLKKTNCTFVLDAQDYHFIQVDKPNVPEDEQRDAVKWKLKEFLECPVEQVTIDLLNIPADPNAPNRQSLMYVVAAKNMLIKEISNQFLKENMNLKAIDVQVSAQRNIAHLLEQNNRGLAMLSFNHSGGLLTFTADGELYHARFIELEDSRTANAFERIALELQRSLDHFDRQFPYIAITKLYVAPFAERDTFVEHLKNALYIQVEAFDLKDVFDFSTETQINSLQDQSSLFSALGGALRSEVKS